MTSLRTVQVLLITAAAAFGTLQLLPGPPHINPVLQPGASIEEQLHPPRGVLAVLQRSCENCHSSRTEWPLYSRIAPVSWTIARDVEKARRAMNLSEWGTRIAPKPYRAIGLLTASCAGLQSGRMPKPGYVLLHPEARVSPAEIVDFCEWSHAEVRRIATAKRGSWYP